MMFIICLLFIIGLASCQLPTCSLTLYNYVYSSDQDIFIQPQCDSVIVNAVLSKNLPDGLDLAKNGTISGKSFQFTNNTEYSLTLYNENQKYTIVYFKLSIWQNPYCGYPNSGAITISPNLPVYIHVPTCIFQFDKFEVGGNNFPSTLQLDYQTGKITGYINYDNIPTEGTEIEEDGAKVMNLVINVINPVKQYPIQLKIRVLPTSKLMNGILALVTDNDFEALDTEIITSNYDNYNTKIDNGQISTLPTILSNINIECNENKQCTVFTGNSDNQIYTKNYIVKLISTLNINTEGNYHFTITKNDDEMIYFYIDNMLTPITNLDNSITLTVGYHPLMILIFHTSVSSGLLFKLEFNIDDGEKQILSDTIAKTQYPSLQSYSYISTDLLIALNQNVKYIPTIIGAASSISILEQLPNDLSFDQKTGVISGQANVKLDEKMKFTVEVKNPISSLTYSFTLDIIEANKDSLENGIEAKYYLQSSSSTQLVHKMTRVENTIDYNIIDKEWNKLLSSQYYNNGFYVEWNSYLYIPEDSNYYIKLTSSDKSILTIDNTHKLENNNTITLQESTLPVYLTKGLVKVNIQFWNTINAYSTPEISLKWYNDKSITVETVISKEYYYYFPLATFTYTDMVSNLVANTEMIRNNKPILFGINNDETVTFSVLPVLPDNLQLDTVTGEISGNAIAPQLPSYYFITANSVKYGTYVTAITIEVTTTVKPPEFDYLPGNEITLTIGSESSEIIKPTIYNEIQYDYYFYTNDRLPLGMKLNSKNGIISGIPRESFSTTEINIYCSNAGGITKITNPIKLTVNGCDSNNNEISFTLQYYIRDLSVEIDVVNSGNNELIYQNKQHNKDSYYEVTKCVKVGSYNLHIKTNAYRGMWYKIYQNTNELIEYNNIEDLKNNTYIDFEINFNIVNNDNNKPIISYPTSTLEIIDNLPFSYIPICENGCKKYILVNPSILPSGMIFNESTGEISGIITSTIDNLDSLQVKGINNNNIESEIVTLFISHSTTCDNNKILFKLHVYSNNGNNILIKLSDLNDIIYLNYEGLEKNVDNNYIFCLSQNQYELEYGSIDHKPWEKYTKIEIYKFNILQNILTFNDNNNKMLIIPIVYEINYESAWQKVTKTSSIEDNSWNKVYDSEEYIEQQLQNMPSRDTLITYYRTLFTYSANKQNLITIDVIVKSEYSFIIYLNGEEFYRKNLPKYNPTVGIKTDRILVYTIHASPLLLLNGDNILSIAIYQNEVLNNKENTEVDLTFNYDETNTDCYSITNNNDNYNIETNKDNSELISNLFDNNFETEYSTKLEGDNNLLISLSFKNDISYYLSDYIWSVYDSEGYNTPNLPDSWVLYGSYSFDKENKKDWDIIDKVLKDEIAKSDNPKNKKFSGLNKYKSYDIYYIEITEVSKDKNSDEISELYFKARDLNYQICKPQSCPRDSSYPLSYVNENVKGSCPDRYVGFKIRQCTANGWSNEYNGCTAVIPSNLKYPKSQLITYINHEIVPITPTYDGYINKFTTQSSLPNGLYINETTGTIYGTPTEIIDNNQFKSIKINGNGANGEIDIFELLIAVYSDECNSIGLFPNTKLGLTASVRCPTGYSGYMSRKCNYINNIPTWDIVDMSKCYNKQSPNCKYPNSTFYFSQNQVINIKPTCEYSFIKATISKDLPSITMMFNPIDGSITGITPNNIVSTDYIIRFETADGGYDEVEINIHVFIPITKCEYQYVIDEINDIYPTFPSNQYIEIYPPICDGDVAKYEYSTSSTTTSQIFSLNEDTGILSGILTSSSEVAFITISLRMINPSNTQPIETSIKLKFMKNISLPPQRLNYESKSFILGVGIMSTIVPSATDSILGSSNGMYSIEPEDLDSNLQFNQISGAIYGNPTEIKSNLKYCITYMGDYTNVQTCLTFNIIDVKVSNLQSQIIAKYYFEKNNQITCDTYIPPDQSVDYELIINRLEDEIDKSTITTTFWNGLSNDFVNYFMVEWEGYINIPFTGTYNFYINGYGSIRWEFNNDINSVLKCGYNTIALRRVRFENIGLQKFKLSYWKDVDTKKSIEILWSRVDLDENNWSAKIIEKEYFYHFLDTVISYSTPLANYVLGKEIEINKPIIFFQSLITENTTFSVVPSLPNGLKFNQKTGEISGKPLEIVTNQKYTISVMNTLLIDESSLTTTISLTVQTYLPPSNFEYENIKVIIGKIGNKIDKIYPTITSFKATWFYSNPILPEGLILNENDGSISGIPIETANGEYKIYAINAAGITNCTLTIIISSCEVGYRLLSLNYYINNNEDLNVIIKSNNNNKIYYDNSNINDFISNYNYTFYECIALSEEEDNGLNFIFKTNSLSVGHFDLHLDDLNIYSYDFNNKELNINKNILLNGGKTPIVNYELNKITIQPYSYYYLSPFVQYGGDEFKLLSDLPKGLVLNNSTGEIYGKIDFYYEKTEISTTIEISNMYGSVKYAINFYVNLCEENEVLTILNLQNIADSKDLILIILGTSKTYFEFDRSISFKSYSFSVCVAKEPLKIQVGSLNKILWNSESYIEFYIYDELYGVYKYTNNDNNYQEFTISTFYNYVNTEYSLWYYSNEYRDNWNNLNGEYYNRNHNITQYTLLRMPENSKITSYISTSFSFIDDLSQYTSILMKLTFTNGIIFYINGVEVYRYNLDTSDNINENTVATSSNEQTVSLTIPMVYVDNGLNIFSFEIHNSDSNSYTPKLRITMNLEKLDSCIDLDYSTMTVDKGSGIEHILDNDPETKYSLRMRNTILFCKDDNKFPVTFQLNLKNKYDYTNQVMVMGSTPSGSQPSAFDIFEKDTRGIWQTAYHAGSSSVPIGSYAVFNYYGNKYFSNIIQYKVANYQSDQCVMIINPESYFTIAELRIQRCPETEYYCKNSNGYSSTMANKKAIKKCNNGNEVGYMMRECLYENNEVYWKVEEENHCRKVLSTSFKYENIDFIPNKEIELKPIVSDDGGYNGFDIISGVIPKGINFDFTTGIISGVVPDIDYYSEIVISMKSIEPNPFTSFIIKIERLGCKIENSDIVIKPNEYYYTENCEKYYIGNTKQQCVLNEESNKYELNKEFDYSDCKLAKPIITYNNEYQYHLNDKIEIIPSSIENRIDGEITIENLPNSWNFDSKTAVINGILTSDIIISGEGEDKVEISEILFTIKYGNELYPDESVIIKIIVLNEPDSISYSSNLLEFYIGFIDSYKPTVNCVKSNCFIDRFEIRPTISEEKNITFDERTGEISFSLTTLNLISIDSYKVIGYYLDKEYPIEIQISIIQPKCNNNDKFEVAYPGDTKTINCVDPNQAGNITVTCPTDIKQSEIEFSEEINTCHNKYPQTFEYEGLTMGISINWYIGYEIEPLKCKVDSYNNDNSNLYISAISLPDGLNINHKTGDITGSIATTNIESSNRVLAISARDETTKMLTYFFNLILPKCEKDEINNFKATPENELAVKECDFGYNGLITRQCGSGKTPIWNEEISNNCTMFAPILIYTKDSTTYDEKNEVYNTKFTVYQYEYYILNPYQFDGIIDNFTINYLVDINSNNTSIFELNKQTFSITFNFTITGHYVIEMKLENEVGETNINLEINVLPIIQKPDSFSYNQQILEFYNNFEDSYIPTVYSNNNNNNNNNLKYDLYEFESNDENTIENITNQYNINFDNKTGKIYGKPVNLNNIEPIILNITVVGKYANNERKYQLNIILKIYRPFCTSQNLYPNTNAGEIAYKDCNNNTFGYYIIKCSENKTNPDWLIESETNNCHSAYPIEFNYPVNEYEIYYNRKIEDIKPNYIIGNENDEITKIVNNFTVISGNLPDGIVLDNNTGIISGNPVIDYETIKSFDTVTVDLIIGYTIEQTLTYNLKLIISYYLCPLDGKYPVTVENTEVTVSCDYGYSGMESRKCNENGAWDKSINNESCNLLSPDLDYSPKNYVLYAFEDSIQIKPSGPINKIDKIEIINLPPGININKDNYIISGVATLNGYYNSTITFSNEKYSLTFNLEFTVNPSRPSNLHYNNDSTLIFYHGNNDSYIPTYSNKGKIEYFNIQPNVETTINGLKFDRITGTIYGLVDTEEYLNKELIEFTVYGYYSFNSISTKINIQIEMPYCLPTDSLPKKYAGQVISYGCSDGNQVGDKYIKCSNNKVNPHWEEMVDDCRYPNPIKFEYNSSLFNLYIGHDLEIIPDFEGRISYTIYSIKSSSESLESYGLSFDSKSGIISGNPTKITIDPTTNETTVINIEIEAKDDITITSKISIKITQPMCPEDPILGFPAVNEGTKYKVQCQSGYSGYAYRFCGYGIEPKWDEYVNEENCIAPKPIIDYNPKEYIFGCNLDIEPIIPNINDNNNNKIDRFVIVEGSLPLGLEMDESSGEIFGAPYISTSKSKSVKIQAFSGNFGSDIIELKFTINILYCKESEDGFESVAIGFQSILDCSTYMKSDDYEGTVIRDCPYESNPIFSEVMGKCNLKLPTIQYLDKYYSLYVNITQIEIKPYKVSGKIDKYIINPSILPEGITFDEKSGIISGIGKEIYSSQKYEIYGINEEGKSNTEEIEIKINKITCPSDGIWEETEINSESIISCPKNYKYYISRKCILKEIDDEYYGEWEINTTNYCKLKNEEFTLTDSSKSSLIVYPIMLYNLKRSFDINDINTYKSIIYTVNEVINKNKNKNLTIIVDSKAPNNYNFNDNRLRSRILQNNNDIVGVYTYIYSNENEKSSIEAELKLKESIFKDTLTNNPYTDIYKVSDIEVGSSAIEILNQNDLLQNNNNNNFDKSESNSNDKLSGGEITGIVIGVIVCVVLIVIIIVIVRMNKSSSNKLKEKPIPIPKKRSIELTKKEEENNNNDNKKDENSSNDSVEKLKEKENVSDNETKKEEEEVKENDLVKENKDDVKKEENVKEEIKKDEIKREEIKDENVKGEVKNDEIKKDNEMKKDESLKEEIEEEEIKDKSKINENVKDEVKNDEIKKDESKRNDNVKEDTINNPPPNERKESQSNNQNESTGRKESKTKECEMSDYHHHISKRKESHPVNVFSKEKNYSLL